MQRMPCEKWMESKTFRFLSVGNSSLLFHLDQSIIHASVFHLLASVLLVAAEVAPTMAAAVAVAVVVIATEVVVVATIMIREVAAVIRHVKMIGKLRRFSVDSRKNDLYCHSLEVTIVDVDTHVHVVLLHTTNETTVQDRDLHRPSKLLCNFIRWLEKFIFVRSRRNRPSSRDRSPQQQASNAVNR